jgi:hypothetical protein
VNKLILIRRVTITQPDASCGLFFKSADKLSGQLIIEDLITRLRYHYTQIQDYKFKFKFKIQIHELLFTSLFKFSLYYSKCWLLFKFGNMNSAPRSDSGKRPNSSLCKHYAPLEYSIIHLLFEHYAPLELSEYFIIRGSRRMQNELKNIKLTIQRA